MIVSLLAGALSLTALIKIIVILVIVGALVYVFNRVVTIDARFKMVINVLIGIALFLFVLDALGLYSFSK